MFGLNIFNEENDNEEQQIENVEEFLKENYNGRIVTLKQTNYNHLRRPLLVFFHNFTLESTKIWIDLLNEIAIKYSDDIQFAVADLEDVILFCANPSEMNFFGLNGSFEPYVYAIDCNERQYRYHEESLTIDTLTIYCDKLIKNKLYCSDPIPTKQDPTKYVKIIVADNFRQCVEQNDKNVFVTIHSKHSFPFPNHLWDLPKRIDPNKEFIAFYKINAHKNYIPLEYSVDEYPTSFLITRNDRNKKLRYVHSFMDTGLYNFIMKAIPEIKQNQEENKEPEESIKNTITGDQTKLLGILEKLTEIVENKCPCDDKGFSKYLGRILNKVDEKERDSIKVELINLASNRVNGVLKAKENNIE